jgi:hypothetical protein
MSRGRGGGGGEEYGAERSIAAYCAALLRNIH